QRNILAAREDFMPAVLFVPLRNGRILVHVLDDVSPADSGVVGTEADFAFLSSVRDDAHLRAAEVVVKEILEPHTGDEQEVPAIRTAFFNIFLATIAADLAVILAGQTEGFVEFLEQLIEIELRRRILWSIML